MVENGGDVVGAARVNGQTVGGGGSGGRLVASFMDIFSINANR